MKNEKIKVDFTFKKILYETEFSGEIGCLLDNLRLSNGGGKGSITIFAKKTISETDFISFKTAYGYPITFTYEIGKIRGGYGSEDLEDLNLKLFTELTSEHGFELKNMGTIKKIDK